VLYEFKNHVFHLVHERLVCGKDSFMDIAKSLFEAVKSSRIKTELVFEIVIDRSSGYGEAIGDC